MDFPHLLQEAHLTRAIELRDYHAVRRAIKRGTRVNFLNSAGNTPLTYAVEKGYTEIARLLLESGANPNNKTQTRITNEIQEWTPLLAAINILAAVSHVESFKLQVPKENLFACMELLLQHKADPNKTGTVHVLHTEESYEIAPLFQAARYDLLECVQLLIDHGANINFRDKSHLSPLTIAIMHDNQSCIEALLKHGASITYIEREKAIAKKKPFKFYISAASDQQQVGERNLVNLHSLIWEGSHQTLESVLEKGADVNRAEINGDTPLHFAVKTGYLDCMGVLLRYKASMSIRNEEGLTALHLAVLRDCDVSLSLLVQSATNAEINAASFSGDTPLHVAVFHGKEDFVKLLLDKSADPNAKNSSGDTPMHLAAYLKSKQSMIKLLLRKGGNIFIRNDNHKTPLDLAAQWSINHFIRLLPENINKKGPKGVTVAHIAAALKVEYLQYVLQQHANVNAETYERITPLHVAAAHGNIKNVKLLLECGASVDAQDMEKETPVHFSAYWGHKACMDIMLETGAPMTNTVYSTSPLHLAVMVGNEECARTLINRNCPIDVRNEKMNSPLYESILAGTIDCMRLLVERGAHVFALCQQADTPLQLAARQGAAYFSVLSEKLQPEQRNIFECRNVDLGEGTSIVKTSTQSETTNLHRENPDILDD